MKFQKLSKHLLLAMLLMLASGFAAAAEDTSMAPNVDLSKETPSATIELSSTSVRLLFGGSWGTGTLHYKDISYPFKVKGLSVGGIGIKAVDAVGKVYFLDKVVDFEGKFAYRSAGVTAYKGSTRSTYDNNKGVVFTLDAKTTGLALSIGLGAIDIQLIQ